MRQIHDHKINPANDRLVIATPETRETNTAAFQILSPLQSGTEDVVRATFARRLERERDEARAQCDALRANQRCSALEGEETGAPCATYRMLEARKDEEIEALRRRVAELEAGLLRLANAADALGVSHFDTEAEMDDSIRRARALLAAQGGSDAK